MNSVPSNQTELRKLEVKIASNESEIEQALSLRYNVFNLEMKGGLPQSSATSKDKDEYDSLCEHLIVIDTTNLNQVVGTYRILKRETALKNNGFYSEQEFILIKIYAMKEEVAEVGRSCVHQNYRGGSVISLLWTGLADYMKQNSIRYLIGCGSVHSTDPLLASQTYAWIKSKNALCNDSIRIKPLNSHILSGFYNDIEINNTSANIKIPPLIKGYLRLGAKIGGEPAVDHVFGTTDFFVFFDYNEISKKYGQHYR